MKKEHKNKIIRPSDRKRGVFVIPFRILNNKNNVEFIMFRSALEHPKRKGFIEFPGGSFDPDYDEDEIDTAIRETYEETCKLIKLSRKDLEYAYYITTKNAIAFLVEVKKNYTNKDFQKNLEKEKNKRFCRFHYTEMDKLVKLNMNSFEKDKIYKTWFIPTVIGRRGRKKIKEILNIK